MNNFQLPSDRNGDNLKTCNLSVLISYVSHGRRGLHGSTRLRSLGEHNRTKKVARQIFSIHPKDGIVNVPKCANNHKHYGLCRKFDHH